MTTDRGGLFGANLEHAVGQFSLSGTALSWCVAAPLPAARLSDLHACPLGGGPILPPCSLNVLIEGLPAARVSDLAADASGSPDAIVQGCTSVLINGLPAARLTDKTAAGGVIVKGATTVFIGMAALGQCMHEAAASGTPFVQQP